MRIHDYATHDAGMRRVLDVLAQPPPRLVRYDEFMRLYQEIAKRYPQKLFLEELLEEDSAGKLMQRFAAVYEDTPLAFATFLYCKLLVVHQG